jgi:hypothetical protein
MAVISIFAHKGVSTTMSRIITFTDTTRSIGIYKIVPKLPVSVTAVVIRDDFARIKTVDGNVVTADVRDPFVMSLHILSLSPCLVNDIMNNE